MIAKIRILSLPFVAIAIVAGAGVVLCRSIGWPLHPHELTASIVVSVLASTLALIPILLVDPADVAAVSQAGLAGTVIHLMGIMALMGFSLVAKLPLSSRALVMWLAAFYWVSLIVVATIIVRAVRAAETYTKQSRSGAR